MTFRRGHLRCVVLSRVRARAWRRQITPRHSGGRWTDRYNIVTAFLSGVDPAVVQQWVAAAPDRFVAALHADVSKINWVIPRAAFYDYLKALVWASG